MGAGSAPRILFLRLTSKGLSNFSRSSSLRTTNNIRALFFSEQKSRAIVLWPDLSRQISMATTQRFILDRSEFLTHYQVTPY
ncbi:hypothetical protein KPH14_004321 [Odynerus spinipes]|uniref:Uncharacterized protein n=1 Tax=Odynerus spinipes TaxID=1348599 RepID=A0AAD9VVA5_9HYME|nr:hypothetical protein KPH14_004321 [Odynerus spinipes]